MGKPGFYYWDEGMMLQNKGFYFDTHGPWASIAPRWSTDSHEHIINGELDAYSAAWLNILYDNQVIEIKGGWCRGV
jgi:hypothetical protein